MKREKKLKVLCLLISALVLFTNVNFVQAETMQDEVIQQQEGSAAIEQSDEVGETQIEEKEESVAVQGVNILSDDPDDYAKFSHEILDENTICWRMQVNRVNMSLSYPLFMYYSPEEESLKLKEIKCNDEDITFVYRHKSEYQAGFYINGLLEKEIVIEFITEVDINSIRADGVIKPVISFACDEIGDEDTVISQDYVQWFTPDPTETPTPTPEDLTETPAPDPTETPEPEPTETLEPTPTPTPAPKVGETLSSGSLKYKITSVTSNTVTLTAPTSKTVTSVTVPATVKYKDKTFKVTAVADKAFKGCTKLTKISFGSTITKIGKSTCEGCTALTTVSVGSKVKSIGDRAFYNCSKLKNVSNGGAVTSIGVRAFYGNKKLTALPSFAKLQKIGNYAFQNCTGMTSIALKDSVTTIGAYAFKGCTKVTKVTTSTKSKLKSIGTQAFYGDKALKNVYLRSKYLKTVGSKAFTGCYSKVKFYLLKSKSTAYQKLLKNKVPSKKVWKKI